MELWVTLHHGSLDRGQSLSTAALEALCKPCLKWASLILAGSAQFLPPLLPVCPVLLCFQAHWLPHLPCPSRLFSRPSHPICPCRAPLLFNPGSQEYVTQIRNVPGCQTPGLILHDKFLHYISKTVCSYETLFQGLNHWVKKHVNLHKLNVSN